MPVLKVLNLNIMHGRNSRSALFPLWFGRERVRKNLVSIAELVRMNDPDVVLLQEVDGTSVLSGGFDQTTFINGIVGYPYTFFAPSCSVRILGRDVFVSGNDVLSRYPLERCESRRFAPSFPNDRMGFAIADVILPDRSPITVVSAHLTLVDWLRSRSKSKQLGIIEQALRESGQAAIVAGDFNLDLDDESCILRSFIERLMLRLRPDSLPTYPSWSPNRRIDWIFAQGSLQVESYVTLKDKVSDHLAVLASVNT